MKYTEVKQAWFAESSDLTLATQNQINKLCNEIGKMRWDNLQEEMACLIAAAKLEFGF
jgi:hypothetical protein